MSAPGRLYTLPMPETLYEGRFLRLCRNDRWEYVQRVAADGAVHIVATTPKDRLLLVEQYRPPVGERVFELPAGIVGDEAAHRGESPEEAAARELVEETGWRPARVERLYRGPSSPGLASEIIALVRARDLERVGDGGGIHGEDITVHEIPLTEIRGWLAARVEEGRLVDHRVFAGLFFIDAPGAGR